MIYPEKDMAVQTNTVLKQLYEKNGVRLKKGLSSVDETQTPISFVDMALMLESNYSLPAPPILAALVELDEKFIFIKSRSNLGVALPHLAFELDGTPVPGNEGRMNAAETTLKKLGFVTTDFMCDDGPHKGKLCRVFMYNMDYCPVIIRTINFLCEI